MDKIINDKELYDSLLNIFYGYEEYVFYGKEEYKDAFLAAQEFLTMENDTNNQLFPIIRGWKNSLSNTVEPLIPAIQVYITNKCNLFCKHCYVDKQIVHHMSYEEFCKIVDKCIQTYDTFNIEEPLNEIIIGGGECTLNPEFKKIITYALQRFSTVKILTNCVELSEDILELYTTYKNKISLKISIDGIEDTHNNIRGVDCYNKTITNIKKLLAQKINVAIHFVSNNINYKEYTQVYNEISKLGIHTITTERYCDQHIHSIKPLTYDEQKSFLKQADNCMNRRSIGFINDSPSICVIGKHMVIDWNGDLKLCMKLKDTVLNVLNSSPEEIARAMKFIHLKCRIIPKECLDCPDQENCIGGEKCVVKEEFGNYHTQDKLCQVRWNMKYKKPSYKELLYAIRKEENDNKFQRFTGLVRDRFGFFEDEQIHPLPEYNESSLFDITSNRVKQLGEKNILWSGGIDSTYIVCAYIKEKIPFTVVCDDNGVRDNLKFYKWLIAKKIPIIKLSNICQSYRINDMVSGYMADTLFYLNPLRWRNIQGSFYNFLENFSNRDELYEKLLGYGKLLGKPTNTTYDFEKLIVYGIHYIHCNNEFNFYIFPKKPIKSFFDTKDFNDIAWTQYWYSSAEKMEFKEFICNITEDDSYMTLQKNPCNIKPRLPLIEDNYQIPIFDYDG